MVIYPPNSCHMYVNVNTTYVDRLTRIGLRIDIAYMKTQLSLTYFFSQLSSAIKVLGADLRCDHDKTLIRVRKLVGRRGILLIIPFIIIYFEFLDCGCKLDNFYKRILLFLQLTSTAHIILFLCMI